MLYKQSLVEKPGSLSRGAPSATRPPLRERKPLINIGFKSNNQLPQLSSIVADCREQTVIAGEYWGNLFSACSEKRTACTPTPITVSKEIAK